MIYSPEIIISDVLIDMEFFPAYFLEVFSFLSYALMLGILVQRSGLTIILLMLSAMIEAIIKVNLPESLEVTHAYFPMQSISNLVAMPFPRYAFQQIQDYVSWQSAIISVAWTVLFNYFAYLKLKKSDI
jgi:ABC-2 type transport system permease protein